MNYDDLIPHFSAPRLARYFAICKSESRALALYRANLKLAQAFHPLLGVFEVALRNNINEAIGIHFQDKDWILSQITGFMADPSLAGTKYYLQNEVRNATRKITKRQMSVTSGRVVAEQSFGFWTDMFEPHHFALIGASALKAFAYCPNPNRAAIAADLKLIRKFRNRINHNEPVILHRNHVDLKYPAIIESMILKLIGWFDPRFMAWLGDLHSIPAVLLECSKI